MQFIARDGFRVTLNTLVKLTFPRNKKAGVKAIDKDLNKIFAPMDNRDALKYYDQNFGDGTSIRSKKKRTAANAKSRKVQEAKFNVRGDQGQMRSWHHQHRNSKGHVARRSSRTVAEFGKFKIANVMYVPRSAFNKYRRSVGSAIAKYKAGWEPALTYIGLVTGGRLVLPAFVRKQPQKLGRIKDALTEDGRGFIEATNLVPYANRLTQPYIDIADARTEAYLRKATKQQREKIVERFNKL